MPLSSTSSYAEILAAYVDNLDYPTLGVASAREFRKAAHLLLIVKPKQAGDRMTNAEYSVEAIQKALDQVNEWLNANDTDRVNPNAKVIYPDFRNCRG